MSLKDLASTSKPSTVAIGKNKYLLETTGCGVAFFDYDHDGWLDIFLVNGWRLEGFPRGRSRTAACSRTIATAPSPMSPRVPAWSAPAGARPAASATTTTTVWNDLFVTYYGQNALYRNNGNGTFTDVTQARGSDPARTEDPLELRLHLSRLRPRRPPRLVRRQLHRFRSQDRAPARGRPLHLQGHPGGLRAAGPGGRKEHPLSQQRRRHLCRCQ